MRELSDGLVVLALALVVAGGAASGGAGRGVGGLDVMAYGFGGRVLRLGYEVVSTGAGVAGLARRVRVCPRERPPVIR